MDMREYRAKLLSVSNRPHEHGVRLSQQERRAQQNFIDSTPSRRAARKSRRKARRDGRR